ncbi:MAG: group 1 truncated hemoglobin [Rhodocyclaceae bacterium]|nr:group 1 truncated hemoglobin [Rhodocyclaceae bacterium]
MSTLYERIGGAPAVDAAVEKFYDKVLADERIKHFFVNTDMAKQRQHQKSFLTYAFGGQPGYNGRGMREAHQPLVDKLGLTDVHFDAVVENLATTLTELRVGADLIGEVAGIAASIRDDVLCR